MTAPSRSLAGLIPRETDRLVRYALAVCLLLAAAPVVGTLVPHAPAEFDLVAHFLVQSPFLSGLVLLIGALTGRRRAVLAAGLVLMGAGIGLAPHLWLSGQTLAGSPEPGQMGLRQRELGPGEAGPRLTVYFHNSWAGSGDTVATVAAARASEADILMFAETSKWRWRVFASLLDRYPHHVSCADREECDLTLFSRLPLDDIVTLHDRASGARGLAATVGDHGRLRVVAVHLARPIPPDSLTVQMLQVDALLRAGLFHSDLPLLLMGDFNAVPWGRVIRAITARTALRPAGGIEGSWPAFMPWPLRIRIDQALVSPALQVLGQTISSGSGSDHLALSIAVGLPAQDRRPPPALEVEGHPVLSGDPAGSTGPEPGKT